MRRFLSAILILGFLASCASAVTLEQIISREDPTFDCRLAAMAFGRDGMVYLASSGNNSYALRMAPDGSNKFGGATVYALSNIAANTDGIIATANGHFAHKVALYDKSFTNFDAVTDFLVSDNVGWDAPCQVDVGASGDFYGLDQHRDRILRISPTAKVVKEYPIAHEPEGPQGRIGAFRVCEKTQALFIFTNEGTLRCLGFDGAKLWQMKIAGFRGYMWGGAQGGIDVDDDGVLYTLESYGDTIRKFSPDGLPAGEIVLQMADRKPVMNVSQITDMRLRGKLVIVKRAHPTELFQCYNIDGTFRNAVSSDHERLVVEFPSDVWTAGQQVDFRIDFEPGRHQVKPNWRVWAKPFGGLDWRELKLAADKLAVPDGLAGVFQVKVTPETQPNADDTSCEYKVQTLVEIRSPGASGSACIVTPGNRVWYGRGEAIPFSLITRTDKPADIAIAVKEGVRVLATGKATAEPGANSAQFTLPESFTAALAPGTYTISVSAPGLTCVPQTIVIGRGMSDSPFRTIAYGDYGATYPWGNANVWDAPDVVSRHLDRMTKLGVNFLVDRLGVGDQLGAMFSIGRREQLDGIRKRLTDDPLAVAPEKLDTIPQTLQTMSAYGAAGLQEMGILLYMDAGLPLGNPYDTRKPEEMLTDLEKGTKALAPYQSFHGWVWASNWWVVARRTPEEDAAYREALRKANESGVWTTVLEQQMNSRWQMAVDASEMFEKQMDATAGDRKLTTATACPYRAVESYPPLTLSKVDEVDLQGQFEQIAVPYFPMHSVDFYRRPGKFTWGHPEVWNDSGTGDMILPTLFSMVMRGCNGVGYSGSPVNWPQPEDPRSSECGMQSVYRSLNSVLTQYGPWFSSMRNNDRVVILASRRMLQMDQWKHVMGQHFARLLEAYISCMHAHHPATFAFPEDTKPGDLNRYKAILIVDQKVELEPELLAAVKAAKAAGSAVFYDDTCREQWVKDLGSPLGTSFDKLEEDPSQAGDDAAYWRFRDYALSHVDALHKSLDPATPRVAQCDNPEILMSERVAGQGRYLFVVNNTNTTFDPGQLWRVNLGMTSKVPLVASIKLSGNPKVVYDVFAGKKADVKDGVVQADLRSMPFRVFAILPAEIAAVKLSGPKAADAGQAVAWSAAAVDSRGRSVPATVPVHVRLVSGHPRGVSDAAFPMAVLDEAFVSAGTEAQARTFIVPRNTKTPNLVIEATELLTGRSAILDFPVRPRPEPQDIAAAVGGASPAASAATVTAGEPGIGWSPAESFFGLHIRDIAISDNGRIALVCTNNWDHNLYAVDTRSGKTLWRQKVGHYFAFCPQAIKGGFAVQGFDMNSAEGYHLYLLDNNGKVERRFALYGLPRRLPHRFVPNILKDATNNFAVAPDGSWVASAGDLGLAVWSRKGKLLWSQDWFRRATGTSLPTQRHTGLLAALDAKTLLVAEVLTATAYDARNGKRLWQLKDLAATGEIKRALVSRDGKTILLAASTEGGRLFIIRDARLIRAIPTAVDDCDLSADGSLVAVTAKNQLKLYSVADGLRWVMPGDDRLRAPRISPDGTRISASSDIGTACILDQDGKILITHDMLARPITAWTRGDYLAIGTWAGTFNTLHSDATSWSAQDLMANGRLQPEALDMRGKLLVDDKTPTSRMESWGNAEPQPLAIAPNPLTDLKPISRFVPSGGWGGWAEFVHDGALLYDGKPDPPAEPWVLWARVGFFAETSPINYILIDAFRTRMRVDAITLFEDPAHPESWLRDAKLEYWDAAKEEWVFAQDLLSNAAVHTHKLAVGAAGDRSGRAWPAPGQAQGPAPTAARFRIMLPWGVVGNLRLGEIVFHGQALGCSHPDVAAKRPVAVLFDEGGDLAESLVRRDTGLEFDLTQAHSGNRSLKLTADGGRGGRGGRGNRGDGGRGTAEPLYQGGTFGHSIANWDFEIAENPQPGQYRWLELAWKAGGPETKSIALKLTCAAGETVTAYAGAAPADGNAKKLADNPPTDWTTARMDLWEAFKKPVRIQGMSLMCSGGAAWFDSIVLKKE